MFEILPLTPELLAELGDELEVAFAVFVPGVRRGEIARIGQAVGTQRTEVRQAQRGAVVFRDVATRLAIGQLHRETHAARNHRDLLRLDIDHAELGGDAQAALLGHQQQLAVGIEEHALHRTVGAVGMDADA